MSKHETPMTRWYWNRVGGTLIEEFCAVRREPGQGQRLIDGVILLGEETKRVANRDFDPGQIVGRDIVVVQAKNNRLGMNLMGQTVFSVELMRPFQPGSIRGVALCTKDDQVLRPLLEACEDIEVVVCPPEVTSITA